MNDCFVGISGHVNNFDVWARLEHLPREIVAASFRHHHVSQMQVSISILLGVDPNAVLHIARCQDGKAVLTQHSFGERAHPALVFHQEYGVGAS